MAKRKPPRERPRDHAGLTGIMRCTTQKQPGRDEWTSAPSRKTLLLFTRDARGKGPCHDSAADHHRKGELPRRHVVKAADQHRARWNAGLKARGALRITARRLTKKPVTCSHPAAASSDLTKCSSAGGHSGANGGHAPREETSPGLSRDESFAQRGAHRRRPASREWARR